MEQFQINHKTYRLLALESIDDGIRFVHRHSITDKYSIVSSIAEFAYNNLPLETQTLLYSIDQTFLDAFDQGIQSVVMLKGIVHYTSDEVQYLVNEFFKTYMRDAFKGRLIPEYADVYLASLRETLFQTGHEKSAEMAELYKNPVGYLHRLAETIHNFTPQQLNDIVRVINGNSLSPTSSPNIFNLLQTEPSQQTSLNIKKISSGNAAHMIDDRIRNFDMSDYRALEGGKYYIPNCSVTFIDIALSKKQFFSFLGQNAFYAFKIVDERIDTYHIIAGIREDSYKWFSQKRDSAKRPLQYTILPGNPFADEKPLAMKTLAPNVLLNGDDFIFETDKRSADTLKTNSRRFEVYGIFCPDALASFVRETRCCFYIRRVVKFKDFLYYYAQCFVLKEYKKIIFTIIPELGRNLCVASKGEYTMCELSWCNHTCLNVIYHTHFAFYSEVPDEMYARAIKAAEQNFINFKYITMSKAFDPIPISQTDGYIMADVTIRVSAAVSSINKKGQMPNFAALRTRDNSPLVGALSIRTLEKMANVDDTDHRLTTINEAILTNTHFYAGTQSHVNALKIC